jgi:hypothetical protein
MGRRKTYDLRHTSNRTISMYPSRAAAIRRAAVAQNISSHVWIQKAITAGLTMCAIAEEVDGDE